MMQIKKGTISYQGLNDWECLYGEVERDGNIVQYYFMDNGNLPNGNFIASTHLVEAIDREVQTQHIGMIDSEGNIILPFEHKSIKAIPGDILLVEKCVPTTASVLEAIELKKDPLAATRLVSTPAAIKEKLNIQMGVDGRYLFNDQFSEASIFDFNGNNLINDEYYSFIGIANGKLYFTKNTIDAPITEFSIFPAEVREETSEENTIDINEVADNQEEIGQVIENEVEKQEEEISKEMAEEVTDTENEGNINDEANEDVDISAVDEGNVEVSEEDNTIDISGDGVTVDSEEISNENIENEEYTSVDENVNEEVPQTDDVQYDISGNSEENIGDVVVDTTEGTNLQEPNTIDISNENTEEVNSEEIGDINIGGIITEESTVSENIDLDDAVSIDTEEVTADEEEQELNDADVFGESILKADSIEGYDEFNSSESEGSIMDKVMVSLSDLIEDGRKKQELIENQDARNRSLLDEIKGLKNDLDDKDRRLMDVEKELATLRAQTQANDKLLQLLNDANKLLGKDISVSTEQ